MRLQINESEASDVSHMLCARINPSVHLYTRESVVRCRAAVPGLTSAMWLSWCVTSVCRCTLPGRCGSVHLQTDETHHESDRIAVLGALGDLSQQ